MDLKQEAGNIHKEEVAELLKGGFAPNVGLLREYPFSKAGIVLSGLPYSVWGLLEHMRWRQHIFLVFMREPHKNIDLWPAAYWPRDMQPGDEQQWEGLIIGFEKDLNEMIAIIQNSGPELFSPQPNGRSLYYAALANLHHNGYHIGQIKAIGRQLGVW